MQTLECATCDTSPLEAPRLVDGAWFAVCPGCGNENRLEADLVNVFLPVRFRVVGGDAAKRLREAAPDRVRSHR